MPRLKTVFLDLLGEKARSPHNRPNAFPPVGPKFTPIAESARGAKPGEIRPGLTQPVTQARSRR
jgi:hypothetical protein